MNRLRCQVLLAITLSLTVLLLANFTIRAQSTTVTLDAPAQAGEGSDFIARVNIANVENFDATNYDVSYNPSVLEAVNVTGGLINGTAIPVDMWRVITPGTIRVIQNVPGLSGVSGSGYLAEIQFHVIGSAGSSSMISFANGVLSDNAANEIAATWVGNSVLIYASTPMPTPTPTPTVTPTPAPTPTATPVPTPTPAPIGGGGGGGGSYIPTPTPRPTPTITPAPVETPAPMPTAPAGATATPVPTLTVNIHLEPGWNLVSFNVVPVSPDVEFMLAQLEGTCIGVQTFDGTALQYDPSLPAKDNTLKTLDPYHGYWIKMEQAGSLSITGTPVAESVPLHLKEGWNLVSYLPDSPLGVRTALSSIDGIYTAVLGYQSQAMSFYPSIPADMNTLVSLRSGYGYLIDMSAAATLVYPSSG